MGLRQKGKASTPPRASGAARRPMLLTMPAPKLGDVDHTQHHIHPTIQRELLQQAALRNSLRKQHLCISQMEAAVNTSDADAGMLSQLAEMLGEQRKGRLTLMESEENTNECLERVARGVDPWSKNWDGSDIPLGQGDGYECPCPICKGGAR